jgi:hypothetical protein
VIEALGYHLGSHSKSDLATNLYFGSTLIAIINEFDRRISFNRLKKFTTSLPAVIEALGSSLGPYLESGLATDLYSGCTIANMDESDYQIIFNLFTKSAISLSASTSIFPRLGPH